MEKVVNKKLIRLDEDVANHLLTNPLISDFTFWVNQQYRDTQMSSDFYKKAIRKLDEQKEIYEQRCKFLSRRQGKFPYLDYKEEMWIKMTDKKEPIGETNIDKIFKRFVRDTGRNEINMPEFRKIIASMRYENAIRK